MKIKIEIKKLPTDEEKPIAATTTLIFQKDDTVHIHIHEYGINYTPFEWQVFSQQQLSQISLPIHGKTIRILQKLIQPDILWQDTTETRNPSSALPEDQAFRELIRHIPPTRTLDHADWWNHIEPGEVFTLLRLPAIRNLKSHGRPKLSEILLERGCCNREQAYALQKLQPGNSVYTSYRKMHPFEELEPEILPSTEEDPLKKTVITRLMLEELVANIQPDEFKEGPNPKALGKNTIQQILDVILRKPSLIPKQEKEAVLETIHKTWTPILMGKYLQELPPTWFLYWKVGPPPNILDKNWDLGDTAMDWPESNPEQNDAVIELLRRRIMLIEEVCLPSCINNRWLPPEWFENVETIKGFWQRLGPMQKEKLVDQIMEQPAAIPAYLQEQSELGAILRKRTAAAI